MKQKSTFGMLSKMLDDIIELDKLKATATEITCKSCYRGKYTHESELGDGSISYSCNKCGHCKRI